MKQSCCFGNLSYCLHPSAAFVLVLKRPIFQFGVGGFSDAGSALKKFLEETANMSPDDRAKHLEQNKVRLGFNMFTDIVR